MNNIKQKYYFEETSEDVLLELINTEKESKWRLTVLPDSPDEEGWHKSYNLVTTVKSKRSGALYGYVTAFYDGSLPIEQPFLISTYSVMTNEK